MSPNYYIELWEDKIKKDENGVVVHHPLNGSYKSTGGRDFPSFGYLTFAGHDLDRSQILEDLRFFYLEFYSDPPTPDGREAWADPLRVKILEQLTNINMSWYLSIIADIPIDISKQINFPGTRPLNYVITQSEKKLGYGRGFISRLFVEVPNQALPIVSSSYWTMAVPGYPIEGYNMGSHQIDLLRQWDNRPRDDRLFREVIDQTFVSFYTFPEEHRHNVFVTNKLDYNDLTDLIGFTELQVRAKGISFETIE